jgi:N-acetylneuraminate synthase
MAGTAGAHAVKFQVYDTDRLCARRHAEPYRNNYLAYQLPHEWLSTLRHAAHVNNLELVLSVYDRQDLEAAASFADRLKVASFEAGDFDLIRACHESGKPVIVSSGMTDSQAIQKLRLSCKMLGSDVALLHCVSAYPVAMSDLNLSVIKYYRLDGFSDHSRNILTGALAVSHGARILEVHVRRYETPESNPDFPHSLIPDELEMYIAFAQQAAQAIGEKYREILPCEQSNTAYRVRS